MNKLYFSIVFIIIAGTSTAQDNYRHYSFSGTKAHKDSVLKALRKERAFLDSIYYQRKTDSLEQLFLHLNTDTVGYNAILLIGEYVAADYTYLLDDLLANGFNEVAEGSSAFGYGMAIKRKRFIHEVSFNILFGEKMKSANKEEVKITGFNLLNYMVGYDLLNHPRVDLFPYIGINHQFTTLTYKRYGSAGTYTSLFDLAPDVTKFSVEKSLFRFTFGGQFDYYFNYSKRNGGAILGIRYGVNESLYEGKYKIDGKEVDYDPKIKLRNTYVTFVLKFYGRRLFKVKY